MPEKSKKIKIAFVVGLFPAVSETFIIDQVAGLLDRDIDVEIFSFKRGAKDERGQKENISSKYFQYKMGKRTRYLNMPENKVARTILALPKILRLLFLNPRGPFRTLDFKKYGRDALCLKLLFWSAPFAGKKFDLVHCHFGVVAERFMIVRNILNWFPRFVTTFYGFDASKIFAEQPSTVYSGLKRESSLFFTMSQNMKERLIAHGFPEEKVIVHPVGINIDEYVFRERKIKEGDPANIVSVGRFVEKKGFDDLLRALAIVKLKSKKLFNCTIIGGGPLENELQNLTDDLNIRDIVEFKGYMKIQDIMNLFQKMHFFVQPSKTAKDGDME